MCGGYQRQLSEAAGCHTSYLSQVLADKAQLTPDHAAGLAVFWQWNETASEYFLTMVQLERACGQTTQGDAQRSHASASRTSTIA